MALIQPNTAAAGFQKDGEFQTVQAEKRKSNKKQEEQKEQRHSHGHSVAEEPRENSWMFLMVLGVIGAGVLGLILKVLGLF